MNLEDALFWLAAFLQVLAAVRFALLICETPQQRHKPSDFFLAPGQFKDGLLAASLIWAVFLSKGAPLRCGDPFGAAGASAGAASGTAAGAASASGAGAA